MEVNSNVGFCTPRRHTDWLDGWFWLKGTGESQTMRTLVRDVFGFSYDSAACPWLPAAGRHFETERILRRVAVTIEARAENDTFRAAHLVADIVELAEAVLDVVEL